MNLNEDKNKISTWKFDCNFIWEQRLMKQMIWGNVAPNELKYIDVVRTDQYKITPETDQLYCNLEKVIMLSYDGKHQAEKINIS